MNSEMGFEHVKVWILLLTNRASYSLAIVMKIAFMSLHGFFFFAFEWTNALLTNITVSISPIWSVVSLRLLQNKSLDMKTCLESSDLATFQFETKPFYALLLVMRDETNVHICHKVQLVQYAIAFSSLQSFQSVKNWKWGKSASSYSFVVRWNL